MSAAFHVRAEMPEQKTSYIFGTRKVLSSSSGEAAEDNVEERENSEVKQFFGYRLRLRTDGRTDVWTERRGS